MAELVKDSATTVFGWGIPIFKRSKLHRIMYAVIVSGVQAAWKCFLSVSSSQFISLTSTKAKLLKHLLIFECAFSQPLNELFTKVKTLVTSLPDIHMVFLLRICKQDKFHFPNEDSAAWEKFKTHSSPLDFTEFLEVCEEEASEDDASQSLPEEFMGPVIGGGHVWCNISYVEYYVWIRQDDGKLDVNPELVQQTLWSAYGVCVVFYVQLSIIDRH
ncbi:hypothetical protein JVT61DRAFT_3710 [Boletus reticuloceps]|uniref:Uncharacterized protein n=1 Tax=Boletus reticuloceps TaxID=495285 RepID=A0A8I2YN77_9AGAM|nr:hypothetical protein JVT61DRAFT_3710 [Boletus reticuloceps]